MSAVIFIGPPGTFVDESARNLAERRGWEYACVNEAIECVEGMSLDSIVREKGSSYLAFQEVGIARALLESLEAQDKRILALASGSLGESHRDSLGCSVRSLLSTKRAEGVHVVYLTATLSTLVQRNGLDRPRFASVVPPRTILYTQLCAREPLYSAYSSVRIDTDNCNPEQIASRVDSLTLPVS